MNYLVHDQMVYIMNRDFQRFDQSIRATQNVVNHLEKSIQEFEDVVLKYTSSSRKQRS